MLLATAANGAAAQVAPQPMPMQPGAPPMAAPAQIPTPMAA
jgi:hypothetical protein